MNFDTKYLIRWGIPGWLLIIALSPYFSFIYLEIIKEYVTKSTDFLALGAILTVIGVPLGYLLNQIHHSITWVLPKRRIWNEYFLEELKIDKYFLIHKEDKERYRYLLSRKHELGGITVSLACSDLVVLFSNIFGKHFYLWTWIYCLVVFVLFLLILVSRNYSSRNIEIYHNQFLEE